MTYSKTTENQRTTRSHVNTCYFQLKLLQSLLMIICSAQLSIGGVLYSILCCTFDEEFKGKPFARQTTVTGSVLGACETVMTCIT